MTDPGRSIPEPPAPFRPGVAAIRFGGTLLAALSIVALLPLLLLTLIFFGNFSFGFGFGHLGIFVLTVSLPFFAVAAGVACQVFPNRWTFCGAFAAALLTALDWLLWMSPLAKGLIH